MKTLALSVFLLFISLAQGCGFHLRGQAPGVQAPRGYSVHIRAESAPRLDAALRSQLAAFDVEVRDSVEAVDYILTLSDESFARGVLSVSARTGKAEEYQVEFTSLIDIGKAGGERLVEARLIRTVGDYTFDEEAALGKLAEEEAIREELLQQAARQIMRRLNALTR